MRRTAMLMYNDGERKKAEAFVHRMVKRAVERPRQDGRKLEGECFESTDRAGQLTEESRCEREN